jgi:non-ribosomal peptide synthetase component F
VRLTYAELNAQANRLARHLRRLGVGPDVLVALCMERSPDMLVALLGILKAGGAYVPLDRSNPTERLALMLADARPPVVLTDASACGLLPRLDATVVRLDADRDQVARNEDTNPSGGATPDDLAYVIYTSGSTGTPKGVMIPHRGLVSYLTWCVEAYRVAEGSGAPVHSPIGFDLTVTSLFAPLLVGRTVFLLPEDDAVEALAEMLRGRRGLSLAKLTPAHLDVAAELLGPDADAGDVGALIIGGEALREESLAFWRVHAPGSA